MASLNTIIGLHHFALMLLLLTFNAFFSLPMESSERKKRSGAGDQISPSGNNVPSLANLSDILKTAKNEFFIIEDYTGAQNVKNVFHENLAALNIIGNHQFVVPKLAENIALAISNSTYHELNILEKLLFDALISFRAHIFAQTSIDGVTESTSQPILLTSYLQIVAEEIYLRGTFTIENIEVSDGVCTCGWVEIERNIANKSKDKAINLFLYQTCSLEGAQTCKADAIDAKSSQKQSVSTEPLQRIRIASQIKVAPPTTFPPPITTPVLDEAAIGRLVMYGFLGLFGIVVVIGLFAIGCKVYCQKMKGKQLSSSRNPNRAESQMPNKKLKYSERKGVGEGGPVKKTRDEEKMKKTNKTFDEKIEAKRPMIEAITAAMRPESRNRNMFERVTTANETTTATESDVWGTEEEEEEEEETESEETTMT